MKSLYLASAVALLAALMITGCAAPGHPGRAGNVQSLVADYEKTWDATYSVMQKHFLIKHKNRTEGILEAAEVRNDGKQGQAETRVSARILPNAHGGYDVEVRAGNYIEVSEPHILANKVSRYDWKIVGYDSALEARLRNEIDAVRYQGKKPAYENTFMESPKSEISVN